MKFFEQHLKVSKEHLDENLHVNNVEYLKWVQEISRAHWNELVPEKTRESMFWVVRTHNLTYKKEAVEGDQLTLRTFVKGFRGPFSTRVVEIYRDDTLIHQSESNWCLIDKKTMKPKKLDEEIASLFV